MFIFWYAGTVFRGTDRNCTWKMQEPYFTFSYLARLIALKSKYSLVFGTCLCVSCSCSWENLLRIKRVHSNCNCENAFTSSVTVTHAGPAEQMCDACGCRRWRCGRQQMRRTASGDCYLDPQLAIHVNAYTDGTCDRDCDSIDVIHPCEWCIQVEMFLFFSRMAFVFCIILREFFCCRSHFPNIRPFKKKKRCEWVYVSIGWRFVSAIQVEVKQISQTRTFSVRRIKCVFVGN